MEIRGQGVMGEGGQRGAEGNESEKRGEKDLVCRERRGGEGREGKSGEESKSKQQLS